MRSLSRGVTVTIGVAAALVVMGVSGCSTPAPVATTSSPSASPTPAASTPAATPAASGPLQCAGLIDQQEVVAAFTRSGTTATGSVTAITPYDGELTGPIAVAGAGGLACAWSVRTSASNKSTSTLLVQVLPGAASDWSALMYGDGPTSDRRQFAAITSAATCGDPGCGASAVVGSSWVRVDMTIPGIGGQNSVFGNESQNGILTGASSMISRVFATVQRASAEQLDFPKHPGSTSGTPRCKGILRTADIAPLLVSSDATYQLLPLNGETYSISGAASHDLGSYRCFANGTSTAGDSTAEISVAPGQSWALKAIDGSQYFDSKPLRPTRLVGATSIETAETTCAAGGAKECTTVFALGGLAIQVSGTKNATKIAEAIIAYAR
jgi:hypothetical protein